MQNGQEVTGGCSNGLMPYEFVWIGLTVFRLMISSLWGWFYIFYIFTAFLRH